MVDHGEVVWRVCRAVVGHHDAEDTWSETFAAALAAYPRLEAGSYVRGWLVTIAHHKAIDRIRATRRAPLPLDPLPERLATGAEPADPDEELWSAVAALPTRQRQAVAYHHIAGLPYAEIADLFDTTEAAARRAASDGISSLRHTLQETDHDRR